MFIICLLFLISQFIIFNYNMIYDLVSNKGIILIAIAIKFLMFLVFIIIATIIYFTYYKPKLKQRLITNPEYQNQLDKEFIFNSHLVVNQII
ncbi:hypothetical protein SIXOD_v1c19320 [Spiroplasma ixodetis Y32]|nr:hypothetical protein SIXOD_v1c19320 [Spiroplasma ixodetis Y32]